MFVYLSCIISEKEENYVREDIDFMWFYGKSF